MEKHPSYPNLAVYLQKYLKARGAIYQAYSDITYGQQWSDVQVIDAPRIQRIIISGKRQEQSFVIPCGLDETLSMNWISEAFEGLPISSSSDVYLGIVSDDSSVVYYKITPGIVKPNN
ncbi:hypothetical protein BDV93DRAFT_13209 [Ceratobasidium sp. AG-I]|nr:hypothetical protein BDV93DRAFT_13209 [Ceratobasidium sp. AG-I]